MSDFTTTTTTSDFGSIGGARGLFVVPRMYQAAVSDAAPTAAVRKFSGAPPFLWGLSLTVMLALVAVMVFAQQRVEKERTLAALQNAQQISVSPGTL